MVKLFHLIKTITIMDIGFEFLLPMDAKILNVKFEQPFYEWEGVKFAQGQDEAWLHSFKLVKSHVPEHILSMLPKKFQNENWQCISILDGVDTLLNEISIGNIVSDGNNILFDLLSSLIGSEKRWVIVFEPDYDRIDEVSEGNVQIAFNKIMTSLSGERNGFVLWCER